MRLTWLGHGGFRIEAADAVLLVDPWLRGNPAFDESRFDEAVEGATHLLATHAHADHAGDIPEIAKKTGATPVATVELSAWFTKRHSLDPIAFNMGGTVDCGGVDVTMVRALHSSSLEENGATHYMGTEAGFMIHAGGRTLYFMGDTDVHADMGLYQELHSPQLAILPIGGHFTLDAKRAAFACKKFFQFEAVVPCHFGTFPILAQDASEFVSLMEGTRVVVPEVMEPFDL